MVLLTTSLLYDKIEKKERYFFLKKKMPDEKASTKKFN